MYSLQHIPEYRRTSVRYNSLKLATPTTQFYLPKIHPEPSPSSAIQSRNLFTTVINEETEEIIEEYFTPEARTPLYGTPVPKKYPYTMPNLDRKSFNKYKSEVIEENNLREKHVKRQLESLHQITSEQDFPLDVTCQFRERKSNCDMRNRILKTSESILNLYNIRFNIVEMTGQDSLMKVLKVKDHFLLAKCLEVIVQEVAHFPYSFFKKIELRALTFCQDIELFKEPNNPMIKKKLLTGMFPLNKLRTVEEIKDYFYKVVFFNLRNQVPDLDAHWSKVYIKKSKTIMHISMNVTIKESTKPKKSFFDEQWRLFKDLVLCPNQTLKNESNVIRNKAFKLKDCLENSDPEGITEEWWKKRGLSLVVGSLDHI